MLLLLKTMDIRKVSCKEGVSDIKPMDQIQPVDLFPLAKELRGLTNREWLNVEIRAPKPHWAWPLVARGAREDCIITALIVL